jgi:hypothetical protein
LISLNLPLIHSGKATKIVTPVEAGVQKCLMFLDAGLRRHDDGYRWNRSTWFYSTIIRAIEDPARRTIQIITEKGSGNDLLKHSVLPSQKA